MLKYFQKVLKIYQKTKKEVPAYRKFLLTRSFKNNKVCTLNEWLKIPVIDKNNYINNYKLSERYNQKKVPPILYGSSGSTGVPTYWYGSDDQELISGRLHEKLFTQMFNVSKDKKILTIICFAMGIWMAPHHTIAACRYMNKKGYNFTVISPGYSMNDILDIFKHVTKYYDQIIIAAHPGFAMDIVNNLRKLKLLSNKQDIRIIVTGDKIDENWRQTIIKLLGSKSNFNIVSSIYGSSDTGMMGYETQSTSYLKYLINNFFNFKKDLIGLTNFEPAIYQYDPKAIFFEQKNNELLITVDTAVPLVRYNLHDVGKVISYQRMVNLLKQHNLYSNSQIYRLDKWKLPFLVLFGRSNVAVTFYALHIYPDSIQGGLMYHGLSKYITGNYFAYSKISKKNVEQFHINIELRSKVKITTILYEKVKFNLIKNLEKTNIEYRKLRLLLGFSKADPIIHFLLYNSKKIKIDKQKGLLHLNNFKTKIIS